MSFINSLPLSSLASFSQDIKVSHRNGRAKKSILKIDIFMCSQFWERLVNLMKNYFLGLLNMFLPGLNVFLCSSIHCRRKSFMNLFIFRSFLSPGVGICLNIGMKSAKSPIPKESLRSSTTSTNFLKKGSSKSQLKSKQS